MRLTFTRLALLTIWLSMGATLLYAQTSSIKGKVTDEDQKPVSFVSVQLEGTSMGAQSDLDGNYAITFVKPGDYTLVASYLGYKKFIQAVTVTSSDVEVNIVLAKDAANLNQIVVIGYGTQKKSDLTGSVTSISSKDFNTGNLQTPEQLIQGKAAGVQITPNGGSPGGGSAIRIRGNSSLNATNDPLFVIDGVPVDVNLSIPGSPNPLSLINPNDIENITILKDASATAIYGSRASNGVIIITTKKGVAGKFRIGFSSVNSVSQVSKYVDVLSPSEFRDFVAKYGTPQQVALLGTSNTNWQKEIYRLALGTDNNVSITGGIKKLPYRLSLGYYNQEGILITDRMQRGSVDISLTPMFLKDHLSVSINEKASYSSNHFANQGAVGSAVFFDPTQPVMTNSPRFGGYFEWLSAGLPNGPTNPVGMINQKDDHSNVYRSLGNIQLDYKLHFFPDLHANLNLGYDYSKGTGSTFIPDSAASNYINNNYVPSNVKTARYKNHRGFYHEYDQTNKNKLLEFYLNYKKEVKAIKSVFDVTAGYTYQDWFTFGPNNDSYYAVRDTVIIPPKQLYPTLDTRNVLISFYGRFNYSLNDKYLITGTLRDDGSSRFSPTNRWGLFPSLAFAWRISEERPLKNSEILSNLKLRIGYGQVGNQDGFGNYPYINQYTYSNSAALYQFGDTFYQTLRPSAVDPNIHWESTSFSNIGLDFGLINNRINGSVDIYYKKTTDLIASVPIPQGTNFSDKILTNVGNMENKGIEFTLNIIPVSKKDFTLEFDYNVTYNQNKVLSLSETAVDTGQYTVGPDIAGGGQSNKIQIIKSGYQINSFVLYQQKYDEKGNPIDGGFADLNGDGKINAKDTYISKKSPFPKIFMGFTGRVRYKKWSLQTVLRGSFGNYVYNNVSSQSSVQNMLIRPYYLNNGTPDVVNTQFKNANEAFSDYYLEKADFVKMDNITLTYNVGKIIKGKANLVVSAMVQNVVTFTGYKGLDPEIFGGIDQTFYPRPRIYSIGLNLQLN